MTGTTRPTAADKLRHELVEWTKAIVLAVAVWLVLRTFAVEAFRIPSGSMENTLLVGDFLFVNKAIYGAEVPFTGKRLPAYREPERNDILVFDSVEEDIKVVKRCIGVPGDTLRMENGDLIRNGQKVDEPYVVHQDRTILADAINQAKMRDWQVKHLVGDTVSYRPNLQNWGPIVVPPNAYFMMGDNRDSSYDSRYWGFLPRLNVRGTPMVIYFSFNQNSYKPLPFLTDVRLGRFFTVPR